MKTEDITLLASSVSESVQSIANALIHPDHAVYPLEDPSGRVMDIASAIVGVTDGLFAVSKSIDGLAKVYAAAHGVHHSVMHKGDE